MGFNKTHKIFRLKQTLEDPPKKMTTIQPAIQNTVSDFSLRGFIDDSMPIIKRDITVILSLSIVAICVIWGFTALWNSKYTDYINLFSKTYSDWDNFNRKHAISEIMEMIESSKDGEFKSFRSDYTIMAVPKGGTANQDMFSNNIKYKVYKSQKLILLDNGDIAESLNQLFQNF